jgi:hypothetical protein
MNEELVMKPASQDEIALYCFIGEALFKTQIVEQALSHSIALKTHSAALWQEAEKALAKTCGYTLGQAIKLALEKKLYPTSLLEELSSFLELRNWLVHKAMAECRVDIYLDVKNKAFLQKVKKISNDAYKLQHAIELDLLVFCESKGRDMSSSRVLLNERYK